MKQYLKQSVVDIFYLDFSKIVDSFPQPLPRETGMLWSRQVVSAMGGEVADRPQPEDGGKRQARS